MKTARWNWLVLLIGSGIFLFFGVIGIIAGALRETQEPLFFLMMSLSLLLGAIVIRRSYKRYEAEVLPLAAAELEAEGDAETPNPHS